MEVRGVCFWARGQIWASACEVFCAPELSAHNLSGKIQRNVEEGDILKELCKNGETTQDKISNEKI